MDTDGKRRDFWISSASIVGTMGIEETENGEIRWMNYHFSHDIS